MKNHLPVTFIILFLVSSCANTIRGWSSHPVPGSNAITFNYLQGRTTDTVHLDKGDDLRLSYKAKNNTGSLQLAVILGGASIWHKTITGKADSVIILPINQGGTYKIITSGRQASGDFTFEYRKMRIKHIQVITNKNIELFGLMLQLDNGPDVMNTKDSVTIYGKRVSIAEWYKKTIANYHRYQPFDSCAMLKQYRTYQAKGFYNDFFISLMLEVDQVPNAQLNPGTDEDMITTFSTKGDLEEGKRNATAFLNMLNDFYKQVDFESYLKENEVYYAQARANVEKSLPPDNFIAVMEGFYQKSFNGYYLVPSLNVPSGMGFGKMNRKAGKIFNTFGPFTLQSFDPQDPEVGYDDPQHIRNLSVHEFGHSFVNPAVEKVSDTLIRSSAYLFTPIKERMTKMSYPSWRICLYESFVRSGEVAIARNLGDKVTADRIMKDNVASGFIYLPEIVAELEIYNHQKDKYPSYDEFIPLVLQKLKADHPKP